MKWVTRASRVEEMRVRRAPQERCFAAHPERYFRKRWMIGSKAEDERRCSVGLCAALLLLNNSVGLLPHAIVVREEFPNNRQVAAYLNAYARRFGVLECIRFGHRVAGMEYVGVAEEEVAAWDEWAGCADAFGSGNGKWRLTVADAQGQVQVHTADFVILCIGRFSNVPNIPKLPPGKGPEAFDGKVIHSMDYSKMGSQKAKEMVK
ncbi:putative flavin-containing monooxygenase 2, partial [Triticum aestivum]|uniref:putative flavin-containing monooxygenase 2 n=1 Tax=Triticum aestivum TaxID=4565 RepID=UPI001D02DBB9